MRADNSSRSGTGPSARKNQGCRNLERVSAASIVSTFCASLPLLPREINELAKYGTPDTVPAAAPVRAAYVAFDESGFEFNREGVRALLFLTTDDRGEATNIIAWAPQLSRLESWHRTASRHPGNEPGISSFRRYQSAI
jgi:hypothetical protein